jgi:hypothetical protein
MRGSGGEGLGGREEVLEPPHLNLQGSGKHRIEGRFFNIMHPAVFADRSSKTLWGSSGL